MKAFTLSGQQLATGTTLTQPQPFGPPQTQKIGADPFAAVAGLCAVAGILLSLVGRRLASASAVAGGAGALSMFIMRARFDSELQKQSQGVATAHYDIGFTVVVLLFIAGAAWNIYIFLQRKRVKEAANASGLLGNEDAEPHMALRGSPPNRPEESDRSLLIRQSAVESHSAVGVKEDGTQFCTQCGRPIRLAARFCERCGSPAKFEVDSVAQQASESGGKA